MVEAFWNREAIDVEELEIGLWPLSRPYMLGVEVSDFMGEDRYVPRPN